jgi:hypothetical protein
MIRVYYISSGTPTSFARALSGLELADADEEVGGRWCGRVTGVSELRDVYQGTNSR